MSENKKNPLTDWDAFFDELQNESPRAAVIIASAFLDAQLRAILANSFIDEGKVVEELLDSDLFTFSSRIKTVYCMGLISESIYHDLNIVRKIRNKFAHQMHGYTFDEPEIVSWCNSLKLAKAIADVSSMSKSHENLFVLGVTQLAMWLGIKIVETEKTKKSAPKNPELAQMVKVDEGKNAT
jgi:DNA-binding MltR family transcriptional regulator